MEIAKKIEAKTIRDGIGDMKDSLQTIGKKITRVSRDMAAVRASFHASAGNVLKVLTKMKKKTDKLGLTPKNGKSNKRVTFKNENEETKSEEPTSSKPRKFKIIDASYTGTFTIRTRVERDPDELTEDEPDNWFRSETMIGPDANFDDLDDDEEVF